MAVVYRRPRPPELRNNIIKNMGNTKGTFYTSAVVYETVRNMIKNQRYEEFVLTILNRSTKLFHGLEFTHVTKQDHGECDYTDNNDQKYDAKLIFNTAQGQLIGDPNNEIEKWFQEMLSEKREFTETIARDVQTYIGGTKLYQIVKERMKNVQPDEKAILFIPFPIVDDHEKMFFQQFATDFIQAVYIQLKKEYGNRAESVYFIYPSEKPNVYVLRHSYTREFIECPELEQFISYETRVIKNDRECE